MSGVVGHMMYAMLGARVAEHRRLPIVPVIQLPLWQLPRMRYPDAACRDV